MPSHSKPNQRHVRRSTRGVDVVDATGRHTVADAARKHARASINARVDLYEVGHLLVASVRT